MVFRHQNTNGNIQNIYQVSGVSTSSSSQRAACVAERLLKQPEEKKLLLLVSDGQPAGTGGYLGSAAEADLRGIKKEYTNKGILFVAAAIGDDKENIERIYGDAFLEISDLTKLPFLLVKKIEKELKGWNEHERTELYFKTDYSI